MRISVDGEEPDLPRALTYKGMMLSDFPNFAFTLGYTNASWTLKADLTCGIRLPPAQPHGRGRLPDLHAARSAIPRSPRSRCSTSTPATSCAPLDHLPKQGSKEPWKLRQNYPVDLRMLRHGPIVDAGMRFSNPAQRPQPAERATA